MLAGNDYNTHKKLIPMKENNPSQTLLLSIVCSVFEAYSAALYLPSEQGENFSLAASFSLGDSDAFNKEIAPGAGLAGWILRNNKPLVVANFDQQQSNLGYYGEGEEALIRAFMGCPIPSGGVLCVDSKRQYSFSDKDSKILQMFAELVTKQSVKSAPQLPQSDISTYFTHLGILQSLRVQHKRWPIFLHNFLSTVAHATKFDYCAFASKDADNESYIIEGESSPLLLKENKYLSMPLSSGIVGWVFRDERQPVFSDGLSSNDALPLFGKHEGMPPFRALICVPVLVDKSARGVLCLAHSEGRELDEALRNFVLQAVDNLGLFLENLYLRSRLHGLLPKAYIHDHTGHGDEMGQSHPMEEE